MIILAVVTSTIAISTNIFSLFWNKLYFTLNHFEYSRGVCIFVCILQILGHENLESNSKKVQIMLSTFIQSKIIYQSEEAI